MDFLKPLVYLTEFAAAASTKAIDHTEEMLETTISKAGTSSPHTPTGHMTADGDRETQREGRDILRSLEPPKLPVVLAAPALSKLDISDNSIDCCGVCMEKKVSTFEPIACMRVVKRSVN